MKNALSNLYSCADNVQDHFRALGGSNQYPTFMNWHIPAFLLLIIQEDKIQSELLPSDIWKSTAKLQESIRQSLQEFPLRNKDIKKFVDRTTEGTSNFKNKEEAIGWYDFCKAINYI
jgi:hypothetical protein